MWRGQKTPNLTFSDTTNSSRSPTHSSLSIELFWTPLPPGPHTFLSPSLPLHPLYLPNPVFFFWLSLIYAFSLSSNCYTLLFTITLIKSLRSTPWWDLFPVLSFWAYDFSPRSLYQLHLFPFHHVWETSCPTYFTPPYFAGLYLPYSMAPSLTSLCKKRLVSTLFFSLAL